MAPVTGHRAAVDLAAGIYDGLEVPIHFVPGNHDVNNQFAKSYGEDPGADPPHAGDRKAAPQLTPTHPPYIKPSAPAPLNL